MNIPPSTENIPLSTDEYTTQRVTLQPVHKMAETLIGRGSADYSDICLFIRRIINLWMMNKMRMCRFETPHRVRYIGSRPH